MPLRALYRFLRKRVSHQINLELCVNALAGFVSISTTWLLHKCYFHRCVNALAGFVSISTVVA